MSRYEGWGYMQNFASFEKMMNAKTFTIVVILKDGKQISSSGIPNTPEMLEKIQEVVFRSTSDLAEPLLLWNSIQNRLQAIPARSIEVVAIEFGFA